MTVMTAKLASVRIVLAAAAAVGLLAACATGPQVRTQSAPNLDLTRYGTYGYVDNPGTNRGKYRSLTTQDLESAVDVQMQARGYRKSARPDLLIDFHTTVRNRVEGFWGPAYGWSGGWGWGWGWRGGWGGPYWGAGMWGPGPWGWGSGDWGDIETYSEGTLTINLIDARTHDAIWSGSAVALITRSTLEHPRVSIEQSVSSIFAKFPKAPSGGPSH
jgi:Domain of unknown function (DUF4136)